MDKKQTEIIAYIRNEISKYKHIVDALKMGITYHRAFLYIHKFKIGGDKYDRYDIDVEAVKVLIAHYEKRIAELERSLEEM